MALISQRAAAGLDVKPCFNKPTTSRNVENEVMSIKSLTKQNPINWKKWRDRAAVGKAWMDDGKRLFNKNEVLRTFNFVLLSRFLTGVLAAGNGYVRPAKFSHI
jgi:hypothetical protein